MPRAANKVSRQSVTQKNRSDWYENAACLGQETNLWYPESPQGRDYFAKARKVCAECQVSTECLEFALSFDDDYDRFGMFGGKSPKERAKIRDERRKAVNIGLVRPVKYAVRQPHSYAYAIMAKHTPDSAEIQLRRTKVDMNKTKIPPETALVMNATHAAPASTLTAQAAAALLMAGWEDPLDARTCAALFMGASYVMELARQGGENGSLTPQESAAAQGVAELAMRVWRYHADRAKEAS